MESAAVAFFVFLFLLVAAAATAIWLDEMTESTQIYWVWYVLDNLGYIMMLTFIIPLYINLRRREKKKKCVSVCVFCFYKNVCQFISIDMEKHSSKFTFIRIFSVSCLCKMVSLCISVHIFFFSYSSLSVIFDWKCYKLDI